MKRKRDKCKKNILQNLKNINAIISLIELFEIPNEYKMTLFELLGGIDVNIDIYTNLLVIMIGYFKNVITFPKYEIPNDDIIDKCFPIHTYIKILGKKIKHAFIYGGVGLKFNSIDFLKKFDNKLMPKFVRKK